MMTGELTIKDIQEAMDLIRKEPERTIFEDEFMIIKSRGPYPETIQLKDKAFGFIEKLRDGTVQYSVKCKVESIFGMRIVVSDNVEDFK